MPDPKESAAMQSMNIKRAVRHALKDDLDKGLAHTFPATDPVSATHTAVPADRHG
jgi:hypothetical protein